MKKLSTQILLIIIIPILLTSAGVVYFVNDSIIRMVKEQTRYTLQETVDEYTSIINEKVNRTAAIAQKTALYYIEKKGQSKLLVIMEDITEMKKDDADSIELFHAIDPEIKKFEESRKLKMAIEQYHLMKPLFFLTKL